METNLKPPSAPTARIGQLPIGRAAGRLETALAAYRAGCAEESGRGAARGMAAAFEAFFRAALPAAGSEVIAGLVELCAIETARARAAGLLAAFPAPQARIVDVR